MPIGFCVRLAASAMACLLSAATVGGRAGLGRAVLQGQADLGRRRLSAGGGYDTYARLLARHFGSAIPGNPTVVVQNMSGADRTAPRATSIRSRRRTAPRSARSFPARCCSRCSSDVPVQHDPNKLVYLGSANSDVYVCYVRTDAPVKTFKDLLDKE